MIFQVIGMIGKIRTIQLRGNDMDITRVRVASLLGGVEADADKYLCYDGDLG